MKRRRGPFESPAPPNKRALKKYTKRAMRK
jgi:hypothetical protein